MLGLYIHIVGHFCVRYHVLLFFNGRLEHHHIILMSVMQGGTSFEPHVHKTCDEPFSRNSKQVKYWLKKYPQREREAGGKIDL